MKESSLLDNLSSIMLGSASVCISKTLSAPLDRVKLVMQLQGGFVEKDSFPKYKSIFRTLFKIPYDSGFFSLWRGNLCHILIYFPTSFANLAVFYSFQLSSSLINGKSESTKGLIMYAYANLAAILPLAAAYPIQVLWTRQATNMSLEASSSVTSMLRDLHLKVGIRGMYSGFLTHLAGRLSQRPLSLGLYSYYINYIKSPDSSFYEQFFYAQSITMGTGALIYPFDTVSRRIMMQIGEVKPLSTLEMFRHIYLNEGGALGFYRGFFCIVLNAFVQSIVLQVYGSF
jgi:solute carrier family 25 (adenine nucleotide translocator) protein 4/5/6/31